MDVDHSTIDMNELTGLDLDAEADIEVGNNSKIKWYLTDY